jgi:hypoxanthine-DNA glycosylase
MKRIRGFEPIAGPGAHTLILGSMPSRQSLRESRYYAHPQNAFWPIVRELLGVRAEGYAATARAVARQGYAVWDVLQSCRRPGSLDADIHRDSIVVNDFEGFLQSQPGIERIFFNGAAAELLFHRHVLPGLARAGRELRLRRLPSTSPAYAAMSRQQKLAAWRVILPSRPRATGSHRGLANGG